MHWDGIIGHKRQIEVLRAGLKASRTPHAYLFVGEPGVGKRSVADVYTRALSCHERTRCSGLVGSACRAGCLWTDIPTSLRSGRMALLSRSIRSGKYNAGFYFDLILAEA